PVESTIPSKRRVTEAAISDVLTLTPAPSHQRTSSTLLTKAADTHKPLESIANVTFEPGTSTPALLSRADTSATREKIEAIQFSISSKQSLLDGLLRKKRKMQADYTRIKRYQDELEALMKERDAMKKSLPTIPLSPHKRALAPPPQVQARLEPPVKTERDLVQPRFDRFLNAVAGPSSSPMQPAPAPQILVKPEPFVKEEPGWLRTKFNSFVNAVAGPSSAPAAPPSPKQEPNPFGGDDYLDLDRNAAAMAVAQRYNSALPYVAPMDDLYDENGDFHGRGRDTFQGPQAKADDIEKFLVDAGNAEQFDGSATVEQALEKLGLPSIYTPLPNMEVALMPHQAIGVAWMLEKERGYLKGGCLADEMGLGKTVQMIALMVKNRSPDAVCKTNLIIAPLALLDQWKMEIELKTNDVFKCLIYHGNSKPKRKSDLLSYDVVITTPHTMALEWPDEEADKKRKSAKKKKDDFIVDDSDSDDGPAAKRRKKEHGLLFQVDFYRVILDEAQGIRTRKTRVSRAITHLNAKYRWCLTGTPIINTLTDTYAYIRFLRLRPFYDWNEFNDHVGRLEKKQPDVAVLRLQKIFDAFLLRRKKDTMLDGKRLIELPARNVHLNKLEFTEEEREIYEMVERKSQSIFNRYLRAGTVLKNYSQVLVLLLRLRQICSHPCLIQEGGGAFIMPDEVENETRPEIRRELARARDLVSPAFVTKLKEKLKDEALKRIQAEKESAEAAVEEECPICFDAFTDATVTPCAHIFCRECITNVLNNPYVEVADNPTRYNPDERPCPACRAPIHANKLFSRVAFEPTDQDLFPPEKPDDAEPEIMEVDEVVKPKKRTTKGKAKKVAKKVKKPVLAQGPYGVIDVDAFDTEPEDDGSSSAPRRSSGPGTTTPLVYISDSEDEEEDEYEDGSDDSMDDFIVQSDEDEEEKDARREQKKKLGKRKTLVVLDSDEEMDDTPEEKEVIFGSKKKKERKTPEEIKLMPRFLPSTKMKWMMEEIQRLFRERPDEKILIISQWTGCLSLISDYLSEYDVRHVKYQGDMNRTKREQAVRVFMSKDNAPIMLMSMKCGGVGLNLTRGNNVISLDLGWSQAVENQAFDRVHRLGQRKDVQIQRLVIENTVEDRIMALQERKQNLADGSLGEGKGKKAGKMSVKELASLFGLDRYGRVLPN
ncbi:hypothetical protein V5O48_003105, partial [Marasmius crinis-equi]